VLNPPEQIDQFVSPRRDAEVRNIVADLNPAQRDAVTHVSGPLLVLAGAGSGKTRVITHRIAHLVTSVGVPASRIVAVTFTNKAASEMKERVEALLGRWSAEGWIGTFHALCLRILRRNGENIGLSSGFNIYDTDDQRALIKRILKDVEPQDASVNPRSFLSRISRAKNALQSPEQIERQSFTHSQKLLAEVYARYEEALKKANAVDFDDLLLRTVELFRDCPEIAAGYASRCEQLLVDEYQDTNRPQYLLVRALAAEHGNVCVVGDEDQCIYRFRGAELRNILEFETDHGDARTIRLEQNYRSTATILRAASAVVKNNRHRKGKTLWTENPAGDRIELFHAPDDRAEAVRVAERVADLEPRWPYESMAVLYRTNAQSRQLEEIFRRDQIPYQVVGSVQFYARKEVKDLLAYLKLTANPADDVSFRRVVSTPTRGIGETTLQTLDHVARTSGLPMLAAASMALEQGLLKTRAAKMLSAFLALVTELVEQAEATPVARMLEIIVEKTNYEAYLDRVYSGLGSERMENVRALISGAVEYEEETDETSLLGFLDRTALVSDADDVGRRPGVSMMTIHCAKGLEFPLVFVVGLEENLFPHPMASGSDEDIEEERRLCYVAMTRARERLFLSNANFRRSQGAFTPNPPSRFLAEIPEALLEQVAPPGDGFLGDWSTHGQRETYTPTGSSAARVARAASPATPARPLKTGPPSPDGLSVGVYVRHPRFGDGRITDREGSGKNLKLTIQFTNHGSKKILPAYTKLQVEK
jgi:DNA helicase-2/ATP-dependent DNA helicase PcrA